MAGSVKNVICFCRVAVIAVVTMLIGFAAIKLMFYGAEKRKKASDTATQPT